MLTGNFFVLFPIKKIVSGLCPCNKAREKKQSRQENANKEKQARINTNYKRRVYVLQVI